MAAIAIDTNLTVLFCIGTWSRSKVGEHKRVANYSIGDFDRLRTIVAGYDRIVSMPTILSQVSDLLNISGRRSQSSELARIFATLITESVEERFIASSILVASPNFTQFGLADTNLLLAVTDGVTLHSTDQSLVNFALSEGKSAELFLPSNQ